MKRILLLTILVTAAERLFAVDGDIAILTRGLDTVWVLLAAFLVFLMQAGFGMVEAGFIRAKNTTKYTHKELSGFLYGFSGLFPDRIRSYVR